MIKTKIHAQRTILINIYCCSKKGFATKAMKYEDITYYRQNVVCNGHEQYIEECHGDLQYCVERRYYHCSQLAIQSGLLALFCSGKNFLLFKC